MKTWTYTEGWKTVQTENAELSMSDFYPDYVPVPKHHARNYSGQAWEGSKYQETKKLPLKEVAARIKREVLAKYPQLKVSVVTEHFSGGCSIDVKILSAPFKLIKKRLYDPFNWRDTPEDKIPKYAWGFEYLPEAKAVLDGIKLICDRYNFDDSDGMIDYFSNHFYNSVDFAWEILHEEEKRVGLV